MRADPDPVECAAPTVLSGLLVPIRPELDELEQRIECLETPDVPGVIARMRHVLAGRGKRLRPALLMLVARLGTRVDREAVLDASLALELIHTAALLHDDCIDDASRRRGRPTVNERWGAPAAILLGDLLFTKAFEILGRTDRQVSASLSRHSHRMACGMNREIAARGRVAIDPDEYLRIIDEKTASLFVAACDMGGRLARLGEDMTESLTGYARELGLAFQIVDDILDFTGDPLDLGKPVGSDYRQGFATLPLIHALEHGEPATARRIADRFRSGPPSVEEWTRVRSFVLASGGVEIARQRAAGHAAKATEHLGRLDGLPGIEPLHSVVELVIARG